MHEEVHTIPVPQGWSVEQAWEAINRGDQLPPAERWASVLIRGEKLEGELRDGVLVKVL